MCESDDEDDPESEEDEEVTVAPGGKTVDVWITVVYTWPSADVPTTVVGTAVVKDAVSVDVDVVELLVFVALDVPLLEPEPELEPLDCADDAVFDADVEEEVLEVLLVLLEVVDEVVELLLLVVVLADVGDELDVVAELAGAPLAIVVTLDLVFFFLAICKLEHGFLKP